jgi:hypothetical protein
MTATATELNAKTDASLAARTAEATKPKPASRATKAAAKNGTKPAPKPAPKPVAKANPRKALTPRERAAKPVTATIAAYVEWLNKTAFGGKMTAAQKSAAGISITCYGNYQSSPERRAARGA